MLSVWKLIDKAYFKEVGHNLFLIEFFETLDIQKVQERYPWSFDHNLSCFKEYDASLIPNQNKFIKEPMWFKCIISHLEWWTKYMEKC